MEEGREEERRLHCPRSAALPTNGEFDYVVNQCTYQPTEEDEPLEIKVLDYSRTAAVLWGVVKQQAAKIEELDAMISALE